VILKEVFQSSAKQSPIPVITRSKWKGAWPWWLLLRDFSWNMLQEKAHQTLLMPCVRNPI